MTYLYALAWTLLVQTPVEEEAWLAGRWVWSEASLTSDLRNCKGSMSLFYGADGSYRFGPTAGRWRVEGDNLVEIASVSDRESGNGAAPTVGQPYRARIERIGIDQFVKYFDSGTRLHFLRCPVGR